MEGGFKHRQTSVIEKDKPQGQLRKEDFRKRRRKYDELQEETAHMFLSRSSSEQ